MTPSYAEKFISSTYNGAPDDDGSLLPVVVRLLCRGGSGGGMPDGSDEDVPPFSETPRQYVVFHVSQTE